MCAVQNGEGWVLMACVCAVHIGEGWVLMACVYVCSTEWKRMGFDGMCSVHIGGGWVLMACVQYTLEKGGF